LSNLRIAHPPLLLQEKGPGVEVVLFPRGRGLRWFSNPGVEVVLFPSGLGMRWLYIPGGRGLRYILTLIISIQF
jgi:hypothetical protein